MLHCFIFHNVKRACLLESQPPYHSRYANRALRLSGSEPLEVRPPMTSHGWRDGGTEEEEEDEAGVWSIRRTTTDGKWKLQYDVRCSAADSLLVLVVLKWTGGAVGTSPEFHLPTFASRGAKLVNPCKG